MSLKKHLIAKWLCLGIFSGIVWHVNAQVISEPTQVTLSTPKTVNYVVSGSTQKRIEMNVSISSRYASLTIKENNTTLIDNIDVPNAGTHTLNALVNFSSTGNKQLTLLASGTNITVNSLSIKNVNDISVPDYSDISNEIGLIDEPSLKYAGPTVADMDNDGDYDLVLNNHNDSPNKLYFNDGNGSLTKHNGDLALWNRMDLHGSAAGDYDNDGDLDLVLTLGGGNGTSPTPPLFYKNNNNTLNLSVDGAAEVGLTSGARGRSARWGDFDLDGDLDLALFNAAGINGNNGAQHIFYTNNGSGQFSTINVPGLEAASGDRILMADLNNDYIDDFVILSPLSIWKGNGNFTFTNMTNSWLPASLRNKNGAISATDIDIDNDGDFDLYLAFGKGYFSIADQNSVDFDPVRKVVDFRISGSTGTSPFDVKADGSIVLKGFETVFRSTYNGNFPIFLGSAKQSNIVSDSSDSLTITRAMASGWPNNRTANGLYIGHTGNGNWKFESHRNGNLFWSIHFTLEGVSEFTSPWAPLNRNVQDVLLRNDGNSFVNVSSEWNIPKGGNHWGVTVGDFNNDSHNDLYVHRFGFLKNRLSDYMLLNNGQGRFEITTHHNANNAGASSHGDMGQAFDFDLDGDVDILNGDDEYGVWHLYQNNKADNGNYAIVKVGYSPISNVDPISADITLTTGSNTYHKRVSSSGESHSQSLLNMVHFGLGNDTDITKVTVRWRNGEIKEFTGVSINQIIDTNTTTDTTNSVSITSAPLSVVPGESFNVSVNYQSSAQHELVALVNSPSGTWLTNAKKTVNAGSGNETLTITPPSAWAVANNYTIGVVIRPVNGNWASNFDHKTATFNVVSASTSDPIDIEAEDYFDTGGTFDDASAGGPGFGANKSASSINYVNNGDWMDYDVSIPEAGTYEIVYNISSPISGSTISIGNQSSVSSTTSVPNNNAWDSYQPLTASQTISLNAGSQIIRLTAGGTTWSWNLDKFTLRRVGAL